MAQWPTKYPEENLDFGLNWLPGLNSGDTIASSDWDVPATITAGATSFTDTTTTIWLSGGDAGLMPVLTNTVVTAEGRTIIERVSIPIGWTVDD